MNNNKNNELFPKCVICMELCEDKYGNNPNPIKKTGSCCDKCDLYKVTPARLMLMSPLINKSPPPLYVLEVVRIVTEKNGDDGLLIKYGKLEHIGYMNKKFKSKNDACSFYNTYNKHMRPLNLYNTYMSGCDPNNRRLYIVRTDYGLHTNIHPFPYVTNIE
jgi:hypothetical protein